MKQKTIAQPVSIKGIGLHKGNEVQITFKPAGVDHGIVFVRTDIEGDNRISASIENVVGVERGTSIGNDKFKIYTVEHVLSALAITGVTNALIELNASEPPEIDGSSQPFIQMIEENGVVEQDGEIEPFHVKEMIELGDKGKSLIILPSKELKISFTIHYDHPAIGTQFAEFSSNADNFRQHVAGARTFGFLAEHEKLKERGLALGGSMENAVVLGEDGVLNDSLRWSDEFVRHKILDVLGDLFLLSRPIRGHVVGIKSGHALNVELARKIQLMIDRENGRNQLDVSAIKEILPHRYPFLLVDRVVEIEEGVRCRGYKNVTVNEEFFQGHYPSRPVMPGVLVVEALAQLAGVFMLSRSEHSGKLPFFVGIDKVRFRKPVEPGDCLILEVEVIKIKGNSGKVSAKATVNGKVAASGELMFILVEG